VGIRRASIPLGIRQCVCLGLVEVTQQGHRSSAGFHTPSTYRLTYLNGCGQSPPPTDEWRLIRSPDEAQAALEKARRIKNWGTQPLLKKQKPGRVNASEPDAAAGPDEARSWAR
jgi:hypothetical protein